MDFTLSAEHVALQDATRRQLGAQWPMTRVRALETSGGIDRAGWGELAGAGVFGLRLPERAGGAGLGMVETVLVYEELGRALVPGPLVASHLAAGLLDGALDGSVIVTTVIGTNGVRLIPYPDADVVVALDAGSLVASPAKGAAGDRPLPLDPLTPVAAGGAAPGSGRRVGAAAEGRRWHRDGALLTAALQLGIAARVTELSVDYAKSRTQFDKPIGSFQAVKHLLADMFVRAEMARAAVYAAAVTSDDPDVGDVGRAVATAKVLAGEAALANAKTAVQVHGGMGFTWEVDIHLYLKRAWVLDAMFGSADEHAWELAEVLEPARP